MKRKNLLKKIGIFMAAGILSLVMVSPVAASESSLLDKLETEADYAEDTSYIRTRGNNLAYGTSRISRLSSHEVNIYGLTQCHRLCSSVYLTMALEWKVGDDYGTYKIWDFSETNVTSMSRSMNVIVPSGHYYRLRGYHAAKEAGVKESTTTLTGGVLVK